MWIVARTSDANLPFQLWIYDSFTGCCGHGQVRGHRVHERPRVTDVRRARA